MSIASGDMIVDKYRIIEPIGEGRTTRVWLAEELDGNGRRVAIKEPLPGLAPSVRDACERRFYHGISLSMQMMDAGAPHVVLAWTVEQHEDTSLLVMQYMSGGSLANVLQAHPEGMPLDAVLRIADDLLIALEGFHYLPSEPVHRDIKPTNVLFDEVGRAYLTDFGQAQIAGGSGRSQLMGASHPATPLYAAPEQLESPDPVSPGADLYALGCVIFEMLTGQALPESAGGDASEQPATRHAGLARRAVGQSIAGTHVGPLATRRRIPRCPGASHLGHETRDRRQDAPRGKARGHAGGRRIDENGAGTTATRR